MSAITRIKKMFQGRGLSGDTPFQTYYGGLVSQGLEGGPSAREARRDFDNLRRHISHTGIY
jgi:hypothetical protein